VVRRDEPPELWGNGDDAAPGAVEAAAVGRDRVVVELAQVARTVQDGCERDQGRVLGTGRLVSQRGCARDCGAELVRSDLAEAPFTTESTAEESVALPSRVNASMAARMRV
jgi:hypothetical protein